MMKEKPLSRQYSDVFSLPLQVYYDSVPDPVCILDSDFYIVYRNKTFTSLFFPGTMPLDITSDPVFFLLNNSFAACKEQCLRIRDPQDFVIATAEITLPEGIKNWFRFRITPLVLEQNVSGFLISGTDCTLEHMQESDLLRTETLLRLIQEVGDFHFFDKDPDGRIQQVVSRAGMVMKTRYSSYIEISGEAYNVSIVERYLWSIRYGFLIGSDFDEEETLASFYEFFHDLLTRNPVLVPRNKVRGVIGRIMDERRCTSLVMVPLTHNESLVGVLILWEESETRKWNLPERVVLMVLASIIEGEISKRQMFSIISRSEQKFRGLIDQIGDMYFLTDKSGYLVFVSPSMVKNLGYLTIDDLIGMSFENILHPAEMWPIFLSDIISNEGVKDYEIQLLTNEGRIIYSSISCRLTYNDDGTLRGIEGVIRDISRRKQYGDLLSDIEWKLEQAQKIARIGVWSYDIHSQTFRVSPEVFVLLSLPPEKNFVVVDDFIMRSYPEDVEKFSRYFPQVVSLGLEFDFEFRIQLAERKFKYLRIMGRPLIKKGEIQGSFGILQDTTERKEVEQHLLKYANELEQKTMELDSMRTQLLDMNRELDNRVKKRTLQIEELLKQKDEFIQQIGHDLKTPLTPLVAILPFIRKKVTDPDIGRLLDITIEDVNTIRKLITTVLNLAQMNSLYMISDIQLINIRCLTEQVISDNAYLIHQKSLIIQYDIPDDLSLMMSPMHFETMLGNIVGNAIKYSYIEGKVRIIASSIGDSVILKIQDEGIGIDPDHIPRIFDAFFQSDDSRHDRGSHGLGLTIVKRVVEMYRGSISVHSDGMGKGTTFTIKLKKNPDILSVNTYMERNEVKSSIRNRGRP